MEDAEALEDAGFQVVSMYGVRTRQPLVVVKLGGAATQVTPDKAREMGRLLFEGAEAAEGDGFVLEFMAELAAKDEYRDQLVPAILRQFQKFRERMRSSHRGRYPEERP